MPLDKKNLTDDEINDLLLDENWVLPNSPPFGQDDPDEESTSSSSTSESDFVGPTPPVSPIPFYSGTSRHSATFEVVVEDSGEDTEVDPSDFPQETVSANASSSSSSDEEDDGHDWRCKVCLSRVPNRLILPCRHVFCKRCARRIDSCSICRRSIFRKVKFFP